MAELGDEELLASADAYFATMTLASEQCWKPFSNPADVIHLTRHPGLVLEAAQLFRGARVLDFGCGTGWLTLALAQTGCDATGVDISPAAIDLANELTLKPPRAGRNAVAFRVYHGTRLPLADASMERIVCFDAFHHLRDPGGRLQEFSRVLVPGGFAAFIEPGPHHSKTAQKLVYSVPRWLSQWPPPRPDSGDPTRRLRCTGDNGENPPPPAQNEWRRSRLLLNG